MKNSGKTLLFISSYLPVWVVWIVYSIYSIYTKGITLTPQGINIALMLFFGSLLTVTSFIAGYRFQKTYQTTSRKHISTIYISDISYGSSEAISYLVTLIIPIGASTLQLFGGTLDLNGIVTLILIIVIFLIYVKSNLVVMNPTMMFWGYSLYVISYKTINCKTKQQSEITFDAVLIAKKIIDKKVILSKNTLTVIDEGIYLL